jgi:hypothetical protein
MILFRLTNARNKILHTNIVCAVVFCIIFVAMIISIKDLRQYAGIDLRNRIVGARALLMSLDPYAELWHPGMPLELADFYQRYPGISRVTAPPTVIFAYVPFAYLSHRNQQFIWWALQWAALGGAIIVLYRSFGSSELRRVFALVAVLCFIGSWFWRLHVERGQYYIFLTLLLCFDIAALRSTSRRRSLWLGVPIGISIALRPTYLVLVPILWFMGERLAATRAVLTAFAIFGISIFIVGWPVWRHFYDTVNLVALNEIDHNFPSKQFGPVMAIAPSVIEGLDFSKELPYSGASSTIGALIKQPWAIPFSRLMTVVMMILAAITSWWMTRRAHVSRDVVLLFLSIMPIIVEFTGVERGTFQDVAFLPVICLTLAIIQRMPNANFFKIFVAFTLVFFIGPFESFWVANLRHLFVVLLAFSLLLYMVRGGPGCLNRISASIGGASAGVRLPSGEAGSAPQTPPPIAGAPGPRRH